LSFNVRAIGEMVLGSTVDVPGVEVASSGTLPMPAE
jgi:hypothetical protein